MSARATHRYDMFGRVQTFGKDHSTDFPADFVQDLQADIAAIRAADSAMETDDQEGVASTAAMGQLIKQGIAEVTQLDAIIKRSRVKRSLFRMPHSGTLAFLFLLLGAASGFSASYERALDLPPRLQWNANFGYCGETSFISAGLLYGQYCSQFTARSLASPGVPQSRSSSQLLLGVNDLSVAAAMRLKAEAWDTSREKSSNDFLVWIKGKVTNGFPVIIGTFTNEYLFYKNRNPSAGDSDYDHIVPVIRIRSTQPLIPNTRTFLPTDVLSFSDNGLWSPTKVPPYIFTYPFNQFLKNRKQANNPKGPVYSLNNNTQNYGIAITGVADIDRDTIPVRLATSVNAEIPAMKNGSNVPPAATSVKLTATVTIPDSTVPYTVYRYDDFAEVPDSNFNTHAGNAVQSWNIPANSGKTFSVMLTILSNEIAVFRAVPVSAP